jgi:hypothetical protein
LSAKGVRKEIALGRKVITDAVPRAKVLTLALPMGIWPDPHKLAYRGTWHGIRYNNRGVFLVGAGPSPSPFSRSFKPLAIPRILPLAQRGREPNYGSEFWFDYLKHHRDQRFVSDGDPSVISFPKALQTEVAKTDLRIVTYRGR